MLFRLLSLLMHNLIIRPISPKFFYLQNEHLEHPFCHPERSEGPYRAALICRAAMCPRAQTSLTAPRLQRGSYAAFVFTNASAPLTAAPVLVAARIRA